MSIGTHSARRWPVCRVRAARMVCCRLSCPNHRVAVLSVNFRGRRWQRADMLGLDPPPVVKDLVLQAGESSARNNCIWFGRT